MASASPSSCALMVSKPPLLKPHSSSLVPFKTNNPIKIPHLRGRTKPRRKASAVKSEFDLAFFERDLQDSDAPPTVPGTGFPDVEDKEEPQCPPGLRKYETMVVLRPDMSEDEHLAFTQKYEEGRITENDMYVLSPHQPPKCSYRGLLFLKVKCYHQVGLDWSIPSHGLTQSPQRVLGRRGNAEVTAKAGTLNNGIEPQIRCIVLDIEGTTTPISFVTDVLFPYARDSVGKHLEQTYDNAETQDDINLLRAQVEEDLENNVVGAVPIPSDGGKEDIIAALVANVEAMIKADRKITSLKQLQGHIWRTGFQNKELEAVVYDDVPEALQKWHALGIKVYIYSSGSRLAQRLIFGNTNYGDLRKYLCGFFDTTVGNKKETKSYIEITETLGVDNPSQVLFVTDVYQEATAAKAAGIEVIISIHPGNAPLPKNHGFKTIKSFSEI